MAVVSFFVYAITVLILPRDLENQFATERSSIAAAASEVVYRAPFATLYSGILDHFLSPAGLIAPLRQALAELPRQGTPPGVLLKTTIDGNGVGYIFVATTAFRLFGLHAWALPIIMLALMGLSAAVFLHRFSGRFAGVVIIYFSALTVMLFTPLVWDPSWSI